MSNLQAKVSTNVLDYPDSYEPESRRVKWMFGLSIGLFIVLSLLHPLVWEDLYKPYRDMKAPYPLSYKIGYASSYLLSPVAILLAIFGLYKRRSFGYWLSGICAGVFLVSFGIITYMFFTITSPMTEELVITFLLEFGVAGSTASYLLYFISQEEVKKLCIVRPSAMRRAVLMGVALGGILFGLVMS